MKRKLTSILIGIALSAAAAMPAMAQTSNAPAAGPAQAQRAPWRGQEQRPFSLPSERVEARLAYIKTALKITSAQQPQWDAFANVLRKQAGERDKQIQEWRARMASVESSAPRPPTVVERMERAQKFHTAALARLNERSAVVKPLYAVLSDEQKQVADTILAHRSQPAMHHGGGRHRGA
jgi:hypothetical protein